MVRTLPSESYECAWGESECRRGSGNGTQHSNAFDGAGRSQLMPTGTGPHLLHNGVGQFQRSVGLSTPVMTRTEPTAGTGRPADGT